MKTFKELSNRLEQLENKTNIKPRVFQFPELRHLMQEHEKAGTDPEEATKQICEYYEKHYGPVEVDSDPGLIFAMMLVG